MPHSLQGGHSLGHLEDNFSQVHWNTPLRTQVNFNASSVDATLDTGASLSAVRPDLIQVNDSYPRNTSEWNGPAVNLANNAPCIPEGVIWLNIGFMNKNFYQRFAIIPDLSSPFILGMDFMARASVSIHIPTRTVCIEDIPCPLADDEEDLPNDYLHSPGTLMSLDLIRSDLTAKLSEASLSESDKDALLNLLSKFSSLFDGHLGRTALTEHAIETGNATPVNLPPYRTSPAKKRVIEEQVQQMLKDNIIEPSTSPWAAPVVIVNRAAAEPRFCVDFRGLNQVTRKDSYPLPRVDESLDFLARGKFVTTLDLARGYWQVAVAEDSKPKTAFISHCGLFQFRVLPFGLCNAPATFQRLMNSVLAGLIYKTCAVYLDDIVIASPTFEQHLVDLEEVLGRLQAAGLSLKLKKCQFCLDEFTFLGYRITSSGVKPDPDKVKAVKEFDTPTSVKHIRQFLGLTGYYRRFIQNYARHAEPLHAITRKDNAFHWDDSCQRAMDTLKDHVTSAPILSFPDFDRPFSIHADACDIGLGAALMQKDDKGREYVVAFASRSLHKAELPYCTSEKECLAVIWALEHFRSYVEGVHVTIFTDHNSLRWLMSRQNPTGRLARWSLRLQDFDFTIVHKPGAQNKVPDALSRHPLPLTSDRPTDLLPDHAVMGSLDIRTLPPVILADRSQLRRLQLDDHVTGPLLRDIEADSLNISDSATLLQYVVYDSLLYYRDPKSTCALHPLKELKLFAPTSMRGTLLDYYHDHPTAGHLGVSKTLARLRFRFFWPKMAADVKCYVTSCSVCQLTKPSQKKAAGLMVPIVPQKPWEYVGVDFVGPLPRTPAGNAYLIVFVDYLTKWVEASAVKEATSQVAAGKFVTDIFARHGTPTYLISDRGSPFVSELFEHVVSALGSVHRLTTAYHPQTNATERVNRTLKTAIRAYVGDKHTSWDKFLPQICFALRTAPHDSTGMTPAMMLYGRELDTPLDLITQPSTAGLDEPGVPYPETLRASLQEAHDHAKAALDYSHDRQKHYYDLRHRHATFRVGDLVRVKTHPRSDAQSNFTAKLAPLFEGPLCVSQRLSDVNYRLAWVDSGVDAGVYHVVNMQPFHTWDSLTSKEHSVSSPAGREITGNSESQAHPGPPAVTDIDSEPFPL
uniref:Gypsy retrotransposon integrase-like protein 1 n=1 Tax=Oreochromis niloticus TaxID=8128 RepID=A0A669BG86_ORENI